MHTLRRIPVTIGLTLLLVACGGDGSGNPGTNAAGGPDTTSADGAPTTTADTEAESSRGGDEESWIEIDGVRRTATTVCETVSGRVSVGELDPRFVVNANLQEDGDLRVEVDAEDLSGVARSEDGYRWVDGSGLPVSGLDLTLDEAGIRGGPITLSGGGTTEQASFDLRFAQSSCWPSGDEWANLGASTPTGEVYASFDVGGEIVAFDESQILECSFDSRITDTGRIIMATAQNEVPGFRLTVGYSLGQSAAFAVFTEQGNFGAGLDNPGDILTVQGQGRSVQGSATMTTASGEIPISFEASCG